MNVTRFRSLIRAVLLSAAPCASVACSSNDVTEMPERATCIDVRAASRYGALTLSPGVDGIAFATRGDDSAGLSSTQGSRTAERLGSVGAPCATATDREACARRIDELLGSPSATGWEIVSSECGGCASVRIFDLGVITAGDTVRLATLADVIRAAAPADNRDEAAAMLTLQGSVLDCDTNNVRRESDGSWTFKRTSSSCSGEINEHFSTVNALGAVADAGNHKVHEADTNCIEGRRPANLASTGVSWLSSLGACFSEIAHMEAAAVLAFDALAHQLRELGAPPELLARVARAKDDEVTHAEITARLAHRFGQPPKTPHVEAAVVLDLRSPLLRLALENAVEGCVREAYGALVATYQAAHASDAEVRAAFTQIAADETEHAELSFAIDAWLVPQLDRDERRAVDTARAQAWRELASSCNVEPAPEVMAIAGLPCAADARALLAHLAWAADDAAA